VTEIKRGRLKVGFTVSMLKSRLRANIVLFQPQIHWNTGNVGRTCLGFGAQLHIIRPCGFSLDAKEVKRAGLDYWDAVAPIVHDNWEKFLEVRPHLGKAYYFTKFGTRSLLDVRLQFEEKIETNNQQLISQVCLVFGSETTGLRSILPSLPQNALLNIPMQDSIRSLNLCMSHHLYLNSPPLYLSISFFKELLTVCILLANTVSIALWEALRQFSAPAAK